MRESDLEIEQVLTRENSERRYGSDVVSRIRAAEEGHGVICRRQSGRVSRRCVRNL